MRIELPPAQAARFKKTGISTSALERAKHTAYSRCLPSVEAHPVRQQARRSLAKQPAYSAAPIPIWLAVVFFVVMGALVAAHVRGSEKVNGSFTFGSTDDAPSPELPGRRSAEVWLNESSGIDRNSPDSLRWDKRREVLPSDEPLDRFDLGAAGMILVALAISFAIFIGGSIRAEFKSLRGRVCKVERRLRRVPILHISPPRPGLNADDSAGEHGAAIAGADQLASLAFFPVQKDLAISLFQDDGAWRTGSATAPGERSDNQDAVLVQTVLRESGGNFDVLDLAVLADGLGGRSFGKQAAQAAVQSAVRSLVAQINAGAAADCTLVEQAFESARQAIVTAAEAQGATEHGFCTTLVCAVIDRKTGQGAVGSIGDSESFLLRANLAIERCVSPQQGRQPGQMTACLGPKYFGRAQYVPVKLKAGEALCLASDGVVCPEQGRLSLEEAADAIAALARQQNGYLAGAAADLLQAFSDPNLRDVVGNPLFDDNQAIAILGTGIPIPSLS